MDAIKTEFDKQDVAFLKDLHRLYWSKACLYLARHLFESVKDGSYWIRPEYLAEYRKLVNSEYEDEWYPARVPMLPPVLLEGTTIEFRAKFAKLDEEFPG